MLHSSKGSLLGMSVLESHGDSPGHLTIVFFVGGAFVLQVIPCGVTVIGLEQGFSQAIAGHEERESCHVQWHPILAFSARFHA